jgi:hypothetical protein
MAKFKKCPRCKRPLEWRGLYKSYGHSFSFSQIMTGKNICDYTEKR